MSTLAQLVSRVTNEIQNDPSLRVSSSTLIEQNLNQAVTKIQEENGYSLPENLDVQVISAVTQEVNLESDFIRIADPNGVKVGDGTPIAPIDYNLLLGNFNLTNTSGQPMYYYVRKNGSDWVIGFYPVPQGQTVTVPFNKILPTMTSLVDCPLSFDYDQSIVEYAVYLTLRRIKGYEQKAQDYFNYYKQSIKDVKASRMNNNSQALTFDMQRWDGYDGWSPKAVYGWYFR